MSDIDLWVLAGQSNMEGLGWEDDPSLDSAVDPRTAVFTMAGDWSDATEPLHPLWESYTPVHAALLREGGLPENDRRLTDAELAARTRARRIGAGLGPAFGTQLADLSGASIGLVPAAHGGTTLEQWSREFAGAAADSIDTLYGSMMNRIARASERPGTRLAGILWYQGESDATAVRARDYRERMAAWIADVRRDLQRPDLPVVLVQLSRFAAPLGGGEMDAQSWDRIREAQRSLPHQVDATAVVAALDLGLTDAIHIGTEGLRRLGRRIARVVHNGLVAPDAVRAELIAPAANGLQRVRLHCSGVSGAWTPGSPLPGFFFCDDAGVPIGRLHVVDAAPAAGMPGAIDLVTSTTFEREIAALSLGYGHGLDPVCRAVDTDDLALPAFRALPIEVNR